MEMKKGGRGEGQEGKGSTQFITTQTTPQGSLKENPTLQFLLTLNLWECLASNFPSQYYSWIKILGHENKGNDHQCKKAPDCQTNSPVSTIGIIKRIV